MIHYILPACSGQSSERERNDCTVRALANATGMAYAEAHALLSKHGRRFKRGAYFGNYYKAYLEAGLTLQGVWQGATYLPCSKYPRKTSKIPTTGADHANRYLPLQGPRGLGPV